MHYIFRKPLRKQLDSIEEDKQIDFFPETSLDGINIETSQNTSDGHTANPDENAAGDPNQVNG